MAVEETKPHGVAGCRSVRARTKASTAKHALQHACTRLTQSDRTARSIDAEVIEKHRARTALDMTAPA